MYIKIGFKMLPKCKLTNRFFRKNTSLENFKNKDSKEKWVKILCDGGKLIKIPCEPLEVGTILVAIQTRARRYRINPDFLFTPNLILFKKIVSNVILIP